MNAAGRGLALSLALALLAALGACQTAPDGHGKPPWPAVPGDDYVVVAVADPPQARPAPGGSTRPDYVMSGGYAGSDQAQANAEALAAEHGLQIVRAWNIRPLRWYCMLYRLPPGTAREALLARLGQDARVTLAQPLNEFQTLGRNAEYNDPYWSLQTGFAHIDAAGAQRTSRGARMTVAVIDTAIDTEHPDLQARTARPRDFVRQAAPHAERHGTEVAGVIAAGANNGLGIVGVAPEARVLPLRACWAEAGRAGARCNSFTLAEALVAAVSQGADVINLSLGGPRDPLLEKLAAYALARGIVVVGALPASGRREGFPSALPGVLTVAAHEDGPHDDPLVLSAPGHRVLTLAPGGGYDFVSGSSLAAAHVSGSVALLRALDHRLTPAALAELLQPAAQPTVDACRAVQRLRPATACRVAP